MAEVEAEGIGVADEEGVRSVVVSGTVVSSKTVSSYAGWVRVGGPNRPAGAW